MTPYFIYFVTRGKEGGGRRVGEGRGKNKNK